MDISEAILVNINVIDVTTDRITPNTSISISNGKILSVESNNQISSQRTIDAQNTWAIPAYIDMHAHVTFEGREHNQIGFDFDEDQELSMVRSAQNLSEAIQSGVCLIRDVGAKHKTLNRLKSLVDAKKLLAPDLVLCGRPLCTNNGHGHEFGQTLDHQNIDFLVKNHFDQGNEWLKIMNDPEMFSKETLNEIVGTAHKAGLLVAIHAFSEYSILMALQSGADTIEHAVVFDDKTAILAETNGTGFVPTFFCSKVSLGQEYLDTVYDQTYIGYLKQWYDFLHRHFEYHLSRKLPLLAGTDAGSAPCKFSDITNEIIYMQRHGLAPIDAIRSATILPAKYLKRDSEYGSIDSGKLANFIILADNPLEKIDTIRQPLAIWHKGKAIKTMLETS